MKSLFCEFKKNLSIGLLPLASMAAPFELHRTPSQKDVKIVKCTHKEITVTYLNSRNRKTVFVICDCTWMQSFKIDTCQCANRGTVAMLTY